MKTIMTTKRLVLTVAVVLLTVNVFVGARIYSEAQAKQDKDNPYAQMELMTRVMELIRKDYVDGEKVSYQELTYGALKGMVNSLDPHSQFMEPDLYKDMREDTEGKFGGLGIQIGMSREGFLTVIAPIEDTPAARAGVLPGDRIIKIEGKSTERMTLQDAVRQLRGDPDTKVTFTIFRAKAKDPGERIKDYTITRAIIKTDSVKDTKLLANPRIMVVNNQEAKIHIGDRVPYVTTTTTGTGDTATSTEAVTFIDIGIQLDVTPTINDNGFVTIKIKPEISSKTGDYTSPKGETIPIVNTTQVETAVLVKDGNTVIIGGLVQNDKATIKQGIPGLMNMPVLGGLFRNTSDTLTNSEIVIFITPHIATGETEIKTQQKGEILEMKEQTK